jgi:hypothetical protein
MTTYKDVQPAERSERVAGEPSLEDLREETAPDLIEQRVKVAVASARQLMWWRFRRHRVALFSTVIIFVLYLTAAFLRVYRALRSE